MDMAHKIGSTVGKVEEVDTNEFGVGWVEYLRVRIQVKMNQPLPSGWVLKLKGRSLWIGFKYERIPKFYFSCRLIYHGRNGCPWREVRRKHGTKDHQEYRLWLRASSPKRWLENR
jgi:hypothetical protein